MGSENAIKNVLVASDGSLASFSNHCRNKDSKLTIVDINSDTLSCDYELRPQLEPGNFVLRLKLRKFITAST